MTFDLRGDDHITGVYLLHVVCPLPLSVSFGRFAGGRPIVVPPGDYLYVGSAMGRAATSLAGRLLRHATRCPPNGPQPLRDELHASLTAAGLSASLPEAKRRHWHIDYLLDEPTADLVDVWALRTAEALERELAGWLACQMGLYPLAPGLGAGDHPGHTHLLRIQRPAIWQELIGLLDAWWANL